MNKILIVITFLIVPFFGIAQNNTEIVKDVKEEINTIINTEFVIKKIEPISINPKTQNLDLNFKKSNDFISVKAYIKSLRLKRKKALMS